MTDLYLIALAHAAVTVVIVLIWLAYSQRKLNKELRALKVAAEKNNREMVALHAFLSAADGRLASADERLNDLAEKISILQHNEQAEHPYDVIIQKIQRGAGIDELMRDCNLCRDEVVLLTRLYGSEVS